MVFPPMSCFILAFRDGERRDDAADDESLGTEVGAEIVLGVAGQQRQHNAETNQVNEDRQEYEEERWFASHFQDAAHRLRVGLTKYLKNSFEILRCGSF
jgi:hypothetical protein